MYKIKYINAISIEYNKIKQKEIMEGYLCKNTSRLPFQTV